MKFDILELSLQINSYDFKLGHPVDWTKFNRTIEFQNKVKFRKLGWFGKWYEGAALKEDQLYKISGCYIEFLDAKFGLVPTDVSSPSGSCSISTCLYLQRNILRKINIFATSPNLPSHGLPGMAETLMEAFYSQCCDIFGQPSVPLNPGDGQPIEDAFAWSDSDSIIKISIHYKKIFVVMWEILHPAWNAKTFALKKE